MGPHHGHREQRRGIIAVAGCLLLLGMVLTALPVAADPHGRAAPSTAGRALSVDAVIVSIGYTSNGTTKLHPNLGERVVFTINVRNVGIDNATWVNVSLGYSNGTPPTIDLGAVNRTGNLTNVSTSPNGWDFNFTLETLDAGLTVGTNYTFAADVGTHNDTNVTNDHFEVVISFEGPLFDQPIIAYLTTEPSSVELGQPIFLEMVVRNLGNNASINQTLTLSIDGVPLANQTIEELYPFTIFGDQYPLNTTWQTTNATIGVHEACAQVSPTVSQLCANVTVTEVLVPDLVVESFMVLPNATQVSEPVIFSANVVNLGTGSAAPCNVTFLRVANPFLVLNESRIFESLGPGEHATVSFSYNTTGLGVGSHKIRATVDREGVLAENNTTNNHLDVVLNLTSFPDLSPEGLNFTVGGVVANTAIVGQSVHVSTTVANLGYDTSPADAQLALLLDGDTELGRKGLLPLGPLGNFTKTFDWDTTGVPAGVHALCVQADPDETVVELDEANNRRCASFAISAVPSVPDLVVESLAITPLVIDLGAPLQLTTKVSVSGLKGDLETNLRYTFGPAGGAPGGPIETQAVFLSEAQPSKLVPLTWTASGTYASGVYDLCAQIDPHDVVEETQEENNRACGSVTLRDPVSFRFQLEVISVTFPGASAVKGKTAREEVAITSGKPVTLQTVLHNGGNAEARLTYLVFYIDEQNVGAQLIPPVGPGNNTTVNYTYSANEVGQLTFRLEVREGSPTGILRHDYHVPTVLLVRPAGSESAIIPMLYVIIAIALLLVIVVAVIALRRRPGPTYIDYRASRSAATTDDSEDEAVDYTSELGDE